MPADKINFDGRFIYSVNTSENLLHRNNALTAGTWKFLL